MQKNENLTFNDLPQVVAQLRDEVMGMRATAGGRSGISVGGGGSNCELTNWDGTKKKTGWGIG